MKISLFLINITSVIYVCVDAQYEPLLLIKETTSLNTTWKLPEKTIPAIDDKNVIPTCPVETEAGKKNFQTIIEQFPDARYCLYGKKRDQGNTKCCKEEIKPMLFPHRDPSTNDTELCGNSPNHKLYNFGFYFCGSSIVLKTLEKQTDQEVVEKFDFYIKNTSSVFTIYQLCINTEKGKTIWTKHAIQTHQMFLDENVERLQGEGGGDAEISTYPFHFAANTFTETQQKYATQDQAFDIMNETFMVPKEHIAVRVWRKTITHFLNVAPLWNRLQKLMTAINEGCKKISLDLYSKKRRLIITTIVEDKKTNTNGNFLKNIWYKLLYKPRDNEAILIILDSAPEIESETFVCQEKINCKIERWYEKKGQDDEEISPDILQYRYCCYPTTADLEQIFKKFMGLVDGRLNLDEYLK